MNRRRRNPDYNDYMRWSTEGRIISECKPRADVGFLPADKEFSFTVIHRIPPSVNHYLRIGKGGSVFKTDKAKIFQREFGAAAIGAGARLVDGRVTIRMILVANEEDVDTDNILKLLFDSLIGIVYPDDKKVWGYTLRRRERARDEKPYVILRCERFR